MGKSNSLNDSLLSGYVESLTMEGEGITRVDGKVYFVEGALPGETVEFNVRSNRRKHGKGKLVNIIDSPGHVGRMEADCEYFGICGGCSLRHYRQSLQLQTKQQSLLDALARIAKTEPETILQPLSGDWLHYRRKARLGVRYVEKKGGALVGFREKNSSYITPLNHCLTLTREIAELLPGLARLVNRLSVKNRLPQIEAAQGDNQLSLIFRHLEPLNETDLALIEQFSEHNNIQTYLQPKGLDSIKSLYPAAPDELYYELKAYGLRYYFSPPDFIQVNAQANELLIDQAMQLLNPQATDCILDLYCGLGNFSLPMAMPSKHVFAVEGDQRLVDRARHNAQVNNIKNVEFQRQDLSDKNAEFDWLDRRFNKVLLDPARTGARVMIEKFGELKIPTLVYVSCNPATFARDAAILIHSYEYKLSTAGIINMFPYTAHVESIALFTQ